MSTPIGPYQSWRRMPRAAQRGMRLLAWCAPLLAACVAWQLSGPLTVHPAGAGRDVLHGFYELEHGPGGAFRWSRPQAAILLPARPLPAVLELHGAVAPDGTRVTLGLGGRASVTLPP
ncbi:MAG TPA: hypothetical protein VNL77_20725, partial [Roseiflexaceae bacterium]|nr:hypothetical protein [Roseiflexaceae bacterium]